MTSIRPYMLRALHEWILDNGMTPYLLVATDNPAVVVPKQFVKDGKIVLNIGPTAVRNLVLGNEGISFGARFGGVAMTVEIPIEAIREIYARESGHGMLFPDEDPASAAPPEKDGGPNPSGPPPRERPKLKVVK